MKSNRAKRVIAITGASAGIGRAIAEEFAKQGAQIGLIARGEDKLVSTADAVKKLGGQALVCQADVSDEQQLEAAAQRIEEEFGPIDIWVNDAMVTVLGPVKELSSAEIKRVTDVTYHGSVNGILVASRRMLPRNRGHIIQIGSAMAYQSIPLQSAYCGAKHAVHGFIESFRIELLHDKSAVKLSEVQLPAANTPQFEWMKNHMESHPQPMPPIFEPELIARAVSYIADHPRREMWVGGSSLMAILGNKLAPALAERYLAKKAYSGQQAKSKSTSPLASNLWEPTPANLGAHGTFDKKAKNHSYQLWLNMNRKFVGASALAAVGLAALASRSRSKNNSLRGGH